ncbi:uncharacterized protein [Antedon mediterranea]|uniref:uncharacterized protein n=1 Tax=Antedon mediterranea TaxID=105859 RepID=UPI003AF8DA1A
MAASGISESKVTGTYKPFAQLRQFLEQTTEEADSSEMLPTLHRLASEGNESELSDVINNGGNVNEEDNDGYTSLYHAVSGGHVKVIEILLKNGAHVIGKHSLFHVVSDLESAQLLLQAKANPDGRNEYGDSPLQTAIRKGKHELVDFFLTVGVDVLNRNNKGETPLHTLCSSFMEDENLTKKLIKIGGRPTVNSKDAQGRSPLHLAVMHSSLEKRKTVNILVKAGASVTDLDLQGMNPIHYLVESSCRPYYSEVDNKLLFDYIDLLVIHDNAANSQDAIGQSILHLAIPAGAPLQVLEYLVQKGCVPTAEDGRKRSLLHCIVDRDVDDAIDILKFLLDKKLDINSPDKWGQTALHQAIEKGKKELFKALLKRGADVNVKDSIGRQPIHIAAESGSDVICNSLIKLGADINAQDNYQSTPLHFAAWGNSASVANVLIQAGCDVELCDACDQTAQEVATFWSNVDFMQIIHEKDGTQKLELERPNKPFAKHGGKCLQLEDFQDIIDSSPESTRTSGTLSEYLNCLISTPGMGTVFEHLEAMEIRDALDRFVANVVKRIAVNNPKMRCSLYHVGSSSESTKTKYPDEFDYVVCLDELSENIYPEHETEDVQENVYFVPDKEGNEEGKEVLEKGVDYKETSSSVSIYTQIFLKDQTSYEYSEFTHDGLELKNISNCMMFNVFSRQLSNIVFNESFPQDERLVVKDVTNDPKFCLLWKGSRYKTMAIEVDFVPAVRLPSWADNFQDQSPLLVPDIIQLPCLAVPKMTSEEDDRLWRCSLCLVEVAIMKRCLNRIRNSYIAAKSMISSVICPFVSFEDYTDVKIQYAREHGSLASDEDPIMFEPIEGIIPSYILKMAFFHSIEEKAMKNGVESVFGSESASDVSSSEEPDPEIVKDIFTKCDDWLSNRFVPSFFNPRQNVMGSTMLEENSVKAHMFVKYILKLLNEKC